VKPASSPWSIEREFAGKLQTLIREIDTEAGTQAFVTLHPVDASDVSDLAFNGGTFITPEPASSAEAREIIAAFDASYPATLVRPLHVDAKMRSSARCSGRTVYR
jgi:hypothetical protein